MSDPATSKQTETAAVPAARPAHSLALDGWRAVACLLVLFYHTGFTLRCGPCVVWGFTGVHLFFILSGYLLFRPFYKSMRTDTSFGFRRFYLRRLLRIYPAYLVALGAFVAARYASGLHSPSVHDLISHLLFAFNSADQREFFGINVAFWTLAIEAQFYVLLPLLTLVVYRLCKRQAIVAMFATATLFLLLGLSSRALELSRTTGADFTNQPAVRFHTVFSFLDLFAGGMFIAALEALGTCSKMRRWQTSWGLLAAGISLFLLANAWCTHAGDGDWMLVNNFFFLWGFPPLLCAGLGIIFHEIIRAGSLLAPLLANKVVAYIGEISYSVYLLHILVQIPMFKALPLTSVRSYELRTFLWGCISLGPTLLVAALLYHFVEQPFLNLSARIKS